MSNTLDYTLKGLWIATTLCAFSVSTGAQSVGEWFSLFNGKDLDGWTPKFRGHELGANYNETFRAEDGLLRVNYDLYTGFDRDFGHLFYKDAFSHYRLRVEYRFVGDQVVNGPGWAFRNNGLMLHCQDPATMTREQEFPVSIEAQLLGGDGARERPTLAVCTPGTNIVIDEELVTRHCNDPQVGKTFHGDDWVTVEIEVRGGEVICHLHDGEVLFEYTKPQLDPNDADAKPLIEARGGDLTLDKGYIAIQAESHPTDFRRIEIMVIEP